MRLNQVLTTLLALSLVQGELAFAAQTAATGVSTGLATAMPKAPLKAPADAKAASALVKQAERIQVASYFAHGDSAAAKLRFQSDLMVVARANEVLGVVDQSEAFRTWWTKNADQVLNRRHLGQPNLQGFFSESYLLYKIEATNAKNDPTPFIGWLADHVSNPTVLQVSKTTYGIFAGVLSTITDSFKNALTFAIVAGIASALVEPAVRPIREKAAQLGSKHLGRVGMFFNRVLFTTSTLIETQEAVNSAKNAHTKARDLFNNMGYDMTIQQYEENFTKLKEAWNATNQVWLKTNPEAFRNGRNIMNDGIVFRTQHFSLHAMVSVNGAETQRQGYESTIDRIEQAATDKASVQATSQDLLAAVEKQMNLEREQPAKAKAVDAEISQLKSKLVALGATGAQAERIVSNRRRELANYRHTATSLAAAVINDLQYEEFNRAMPREVYDMYGKLKSGFSIVFFHKEFAHEIVKELDRLGFQVTVKGEQIAAELEKRKRPRVPKSPAAASGETPAPSSGSKLKNVLRRLSGSRGVRAAAAREGVLEEGKGDPVREAVRRGRK